MAEEYSEFAITMRGYDRAQVDRKLEQLSRQLADARREVASLDQRAMTLAGELADAQRRLRESDKPTYAGLGSRIEQLLRSAEEQSASVLSKANAEADALLTRTRTNAKNLSERSASEAATLLADARREASELRSRSQGEASTAPGQRRGPRPGAGLLSLAQGRPDLRRRRGGRHRDARQRGA